MLTPFAALDHLYHQIGDILLVLRQHKLRTALTMLGIAVGVWAVITLTAFGYGTQTYLDNQINNLGTNLLVITPGSPDDIATYLDRGVQESLSAADAEAIAGKVKEVAWAAPVSSVNADVRYRGRRTAAEVVGTTPDYYKVLNWDTAIGSRTSRIHGTTRATVAVLGASIAERLFANRNPIGEVIHINNLAFRVIGVLKERGSGAMGKNQDDRIIVPLATMQARITGKRYVPMILVSTRSREEMEKARYETKLVLFSRHRNLGQKTFPFTITDLSQIASIARNFTAAMTGLLVAIASISLIVGGIGVMNVMLAAVTERIGEVGIRRAIGATRAEIQRQFLFEAGTVSVLGGALGLGLAHATIALANLALPWPAVINPTMTLAALAASAATGIFFGYYPARRAARLTPMEALRYE